MHHVTTTTIAIALLGTAALLAGCAAQAISWDKPGVTQAEREQDENACLRAAIGAGGRAQLAAPYCIDRDVYTKCMERRGYAVHPE